MSGIAKNTYAEMLAGIKNRVQTARIRAGLAANRELILLYWDIGADILKRQRAEGWGSQVIDRLSLDIKHAFPDLTGFSPRNLKYMRAFAEEYPDREFVQQLVAQIPWGHILYLLQKAKDPEKRLWYMRKTIEHGWSRNVLALHIDQQDYERKGLAVTNFSATLPSPQSDLARIFQGLENPLRRRGGRRPGWATFPMLGATS